MKVFIAGATGYVGREAVRQSIRNPKVESIIALSRRPIPAYENEAKVKVVIVDDFLNYSDSVKGELAGASGCLWCIGTKSSPTVDPGDYKKVNYGYTINAANTFKHLSKPEGAPFRFVLCSGAGAEMDQTKSLYWLPSMRRMKGSIEAELFRLADESPKTFEAYSLRPAFIAPGDAGMLAPVMRVIFPYVDDYVLCLALLDTCLNGAPKRIFENAEITSVGKAAEKKL